MSKGLEALQYLDDIAHGRKMDLDAHELKLIVEKELKALEIIKKYNIRPSDFIYHTSYKVYQCNMSFIGDDKLMSEEEYNLLKEVLL